MKVERTKTSNSVEIVLVNLGDEDNYNETRIHVETLNRVEEDHPYKHTMSVHMDPSLSAGAFAEPLGLPIRHFAGEHGLPPFWSVRMDRVSFFFDKP